jgi:Ca2+-binding EF-hand superfamily protein
MSEMEGHDNKKREDMNADDYWQHFSKGGAMDFDAFAEAYKHTLECVTPDMINAAWNEGDNNGDMMMDKNEFMDMVRHYEEEAMKKDSMKAEDYWNKFSDGKGMDYESFARGMRYAEECVND